MVTTEHQVQRGHQTDGILHILAAAFAVRFDVSNAARRDYGKFEDTFEAQSLFPFFRAAGP